ncbi:hypothetical protein [Actinomyces minihominis]|uniref:hypothetical protein n=1 Tax=Actinomyces minihominis TaxID=2002838 RepID=UPI0013EBC0A5|nr:hypothetical protein [Actinomyces minihominis]
MYRSIFRLLPGPVWLKWIWSLLLIAGAVYLLFEYVYPWVNTTYFDTTVDV